MKVRFYELDPYDHVNHANYFVYFETARIEFLSDMDWGLVSLKDRGMQIVVVGISARFQASARYGDDLAIHTWVSEIGRVRSTWNQVMFRDEEVVATVEVEAAVTDLSGRPRRLPPEFRERFTGAVA